MSATYEDMTNEELRALLEDRGLPVSGNKEELVARLELADAEAEQGADPDGGQPDSDDGQSDSDETGTTPDAPEPDEGEGQGDAPDVSEAPDTPEGAPEGEDDTPSEPEAPEGAPDAEPEVTEGDTPEDTDEDEEPEPEPEFVNPPISERAAEALRKAGVEPSMRASTRTKVEVELPERETSDAAYGHLPPQMRPSNQSKGVAGYRVLPDGRRQPLKLVKPEDG